MAETAVKLTDWLDLSDEAHEAAQAIGNAGPTVNVQDKQLKGYVFDADGGGGKEYYSAATLRLYAKGLAEIADWLDRRALLDALKDEGEGR